MNHSSQHIPYQDARLLPFSPDMNVDGATLIGSNSSTPLLSSPPTPFDVRSPSSEADGLPLKKRKHSHLDNSDESPNSPDASSVPCLCTPEPKIPRPRNAFILYRQYHYASVVAKHPGINNPDISKIIGEAWRNEPETEKLRWKGYADEDKAQHQQRYPTYRYQPKRNQKGTTPVDGTWTETSACPRCSRKPLSLPPDAETDQVESPLPQCIPRVPMPSSIITLPPPRPSSAAFSIARLSPMDRLSINSPISNQYPDFAYINSPGSRGSYSGESIDQKVKRHKLYDDSERSARHSLPQAQHAHSPTLLQDSQRRISLPPASDLIGRISPYSDTGPRPGPGYSENRAMTRRPLHLRDTGLSVITGPQTSYQRSPARTPHTPYPRTTMTATFPRSAFQPLSQTARMAVLKDQQSVIKRVLKPVPPTPHRRKDTFVIAVDGDRCSIAHELSAWLTEALGRINVEVDIVRGPDLPEIGRLDMGNMFECASHVKEWSTKSKELVEYMLRADDKASNTDCRPLLDNRTDMGHGVAQSSPRETWRPSVILLDAYMYTVVNKFAAWIPMANGHDGQMHWDWIACMWRGLIAPDLLVYIDTPGTQDQTDADRVDVLDDGNFMILRHGEHTKMEGEEGGVRGVSNTTLRRLAFEVEEWLRRQRRN